MTYCPSLKEIYIPYLFLDAAQYSMTITVWYEVTLCPISHRNIQYSHLIPHNVIYNNDSVTVFFEERNILTLHNENTIFCEIQLDSLLLFIFTVTVSTTPNCFSAYRCYSCIANHLECYAIYFTALYIILLWCAEICDGVDIFDLKSYITAFRNLPYVLQYVILAGFI